MTARELALAVSRLASQILKKIYGRGPAHISVHLGYQMAVIHAFDFRPAIDAYVLPNVGLAEGIHRAVMQTVMTSIAHYLCERARAPRLKNWNQSVDFDTGSELVVMIFDRDIRPEAIDHKAWEDFARGVKGRLDGMLATLERGAAQRALPRR